MNKLPEEFLYEYVVRLNGEEIARYCSDAVPPEVGILLDPWEFVLPEAKREKKLHLKGPFRVVEIKQQPKNMNGTEEISSQTLVEVIVVN